MPSSRSGQRMPAASSVFASRAVLLMAGGFAFMVSVSALTIVAVADSVTGQQRAVVRGDDALLAAGGPNLLIDVSFAGGHLIESVLRRSMTGVDRVLTGRPPSSDARSAGSPHTGEPAPHTAPSLADKAATSRAVDLQQAETELAVAWAELQRAQAERGRILTSPAVEALRMAESELARARSVVVRAQVDLERLNGPDPVMLETAERAVMRAEATYRAEILVRQPFEHVRTVRAGSPVAPSAKDVLDAAVARRDQIMAGPSSTEIEAARTFLADAQAAYADASARLDVARQATALSSVDAANEAVTAALTALDAAEARVRSLRSQNG